MCLLFFQLKDKLDSPNDFKVILISVRDEFMARPTSPLTRWPESDIIGGKLSVNQLVHNDNIFINNKK